VNDAPFIEVFLSGFVALAACGQHELHHDLEPSCDARPL
jgi:hypothetical protein